MKKIFIFLFITTQVYAQLPVNTVGKYLDKNRVRTPIHTTNDKLWNLYGNGLASYEVPKGKNKMAMFANSLWIGGLDLGGRLHIAANTYRQNGADFWPGPLDTTATGAFNGVNSTPYNAVWKVDCNDINDFVTAYNNGSVANNSYVVPNDIMTYPGNGTGNFQKQLSPYFDANSDGIYNPQTHGDYPLIKGQQQILSIYNDRDSHHTETGGLAMGIEVHERSYAYSEPTVHDTMQAINFTTFYNYTIYNRSDTDYFHVYITDWADVDLGYWLNDYIGTDTINHFAYCYNDGPLDPLGPSSFGYLHMPPVLSHVLINTNCTSDGIDNNHNGQIDEPGEQFKMDKTTYYNNNVGNFPPPIVNPSNAIEYYNIMSGFWLDGSPFTFGGNAYGGSATAPYIYPGNPQTNSGWSEAASGNLAGDRRFLMSSGPFTLKAHSKVEWGYAIVFSQDTTQNINTITEFNTRVQRDVRNVKYFDDTHQTPACKPAVNPNVTTGIKNEALKLRTLVYPNPAVNYVAIDLAENVKSAPVTVYDVYGRKVMEAQITDGYHVQVDVSPLDKGVYFIEVKCGDKTTINKLIKN